MSVSQCVAVCVSVCQYVCLITYLEFFQMLNEASLEVARATGLHSRVHQTLTAWGKGGGGEEGGGMRGGVWGDERVGG